MTVYEKLSHVQNALDVPKDSYNKFGEFYYRSAENILSKARLLCKEQGLLLTITDSIELIGDRYYVKAEACVRDIAKKPEEGERVVCSVAYAREPESKKGMDSSQITGSTSSYARKYALGGLFSIDDGKDSDAMPPATEQTANVTSMSKGKPITTKQAENIKAMFGNSDDHMNAVKMVLKEFGVDGVMQLPAKDYQKFVEAVEDLIRGEK